MLMSLVTDQPCAPAEPCSIEAIHLDADEPSSFHGIPDRAIPVPNVDIFLEEAEVDREADWPTGCGEQDPADPSIAGKPVAASAVELAHLGNAARRMRASNRLTEATLSEPVQAHRERQSEAPPRRGVRRGTRSPSR